MQGTTQQAANDGIPSGATSMPYLTGQHQDLVLSALAYGLLHFSLFSALITVCVQRVCGVAYALSLLPPASRHPRPPTKLSGPKRRSLTGCADKASRWARFCLLTGQTPEAHTLPFSFPLVTSPFRAVFAYFSPTQSDSIVGHWVENGVRSMLSLQQAARV